jgi:hypothetical protein
MNGSRALVVLPHKRMDLYSGLALRHNTQHRTRNRILALWVGIS